MEYVLGFFRLAPRCPGRGMKPYTHPEINCVGCWKSSLIAKCQPIFLCKYLYCGNFRVKCQSSFLWSSSEIGFMHILFKKRWIQTCDFLCLRSMQAFWQCASELSTEDNISVDAYPRYRNPILRRNELERTVIGGYQKYTIPS